MADPQNPAAGSTPDTSGQPQPTEFQVPEGKFLVDRAEYERNMNRLRGTDQQFGEFAKLGIKSPKDLEPYHKFQQTLKQRNLSVDQLMRGFEPEQVEESKRSTIDLDAIDKHLAEKYVPREQLEVEFSKREAQSQHRAAYSKENELLLDALKTALPETADPRDKRALAAEVRALMADYSKRDFYPENHPLHKEQLAPWDAKSINKMIESVKKELALSDGAEMKEAGKKAASARPPTGTPAGSRAGQGKPEDENTSRNPHDIIRSAVERAAKK